MNTSHLIIVLGVLSMLFLIGCVQQQAKFVCPDGSTVSDSSYCPKQEPTKSVSCQDGTKVSDYTECCVTDLINGPNQGLLKYCKDVTGTYNEKISCEGDYSVGERYSCQSNKCIKSITRDKCVDGSTCAPTGNTVTCVPK